MKDYKLKKYSMNSSPILTLLLSKFNVKNKTGAYLVIIIMGIIVFGYAITKILLA